MSSVHASALHLVTWKTSLREISLLQSYFQRAMIFSINRITIFRAGCDSLPVVQPTSRKA